MHSFNSGLPQMTETEHTNLFGLSEASGGSVTEIKPSLLPYSCHPKIRVPITTNKYSQSIAKVFVEYEFTVLFY